MSSLAGESREMSRMALQKRFGLLNLVTAFMLVFTVVGSVHAGQWTKIPTAPFDNAALRGLAAKGNALWMGYYNEVWKTSDTNQSVFQKSATIPSYGNANNILALTDGTLIFQTDFGIMRSTDDGVTWNHVTSGNYDINAINAVGSTVFAVEWEGEIKKSSDSGATWSIVRNGTNTEHFLDVSTSDGVTVYASGFSCNTWPSGPYAPVIFRSTDGGNSWGKIYEGTWSSTNIAVNGIVSITQSIVVAVGTNGLILRSTDAGATWGLISSGTTSGIYRVVQSPFGAIIAAGEAGLVLISWDSGLTWTSENTGTTASIMGIAFIDSKIFLAATGGDALVLYADVVPPTYAISLTKSGTGSGNITPSSSTIIWTGNNGSISFNNGSTITLTATASLPGNVFSKWTGCDSTIANVCIMQMNSDKNVVANFELPVGGVATIPLDTAYWEKTMCGAWESVADGLKVYGTAYRISNAIKTKGFYDFRGKELYIKWKGNGGGSFAAFGVYFDGLGIPSIMHSAGNSYSGSYLITNDQWYYTRAKINADKSYQVVTASNNYDNAGGSTVKSSSGTITDTDWQMVDKLRVGFTSGDTYQGVSTYFVVGEFKTDAFPVIIQPTSFTVYNFENGTIPPEFVVSGPWNVVTEGQNKSLKISTSSTNDNNSNVTLSVDNTIAVRMKMKAYEVNNSGDGFSFGINYPSSLGIGSERPPTQCWREATFALPNAGVNSLKWILQNTAGGLVEAWIDEIVLIQGNFSSNNATCGSASATPTATMPATNLCGDGSLPTVSGSGPWSWTCNGINGGTNTSCTASVLDTTPPAAPSNISTDAPTAAGKLTISWTNPADADFAHIHIYRSTVAGTIGTLVGNNVTGIRYTDSGLASQTLYYYTVRSVDTAGNESTNTAQVSRTTLDATPPPVVTVATVTNPNTGGTLTLSWTKPAATDFASITIYRSTANNELGTAIAAAQTGTTYSNTGLTNGTTYYYTLRGYDTSGNHSDSAQFSGTPTAPESTPPGVVDCSGAISQPGPPYSGDTVVHTWTKPTDPDFAALRIYASTAESTLGTKVYEGNAQTFTHTGLTGGVTYYYTYRSIDNVGNETTNTNQCFIVMQDTVAPSCPTGLTASAVNDTIKLDWTRSGSADTATYLPSGDNGTGTINYATPLATISQFDQTAFSLTIASLTPGATYRYTVQVEDKVFNKNSTCGIVSATIPLPAPSCAASAGIKNPHTGKKLGGNSVNVMAEITGNETNVASVLFQCRATGATDWLTMARRLNLHPNPDLAKPWFTLWDISPLPNGEYDIRALATCLDNGQPDPAPGYITVTINQANADTSSNNGVTTSRIHLIAPSTTLKGDAATGGTTKLILPAGAVDNDTTVTITDVSGTPPAGYQGIGVYRDIAFTIPQHTLSNGKKATLEVSYKDDNGDGIVDGTSINAYDLQLCDYYNSAWTCFPSTVDIKNKRVRAVTDSFSVYGLLKPPIPAGAGWNMLSVPLSPSNAAPYTVFSGAAQINSYDPTTAAYPVPAAILPGYAYWVRRISAGTVDVTGNNVTDAPFSISIKKGWNMIGNPFRYKINVADLKVNVSGTEKLIAAAETSGWLVGTLYNLVDGAYQMSSHQDGGFLEPWKGYWILSDVTGTLIVPNTPAQIGGAL